MDVSLVLLMLALKNTATGYALSIVLVMKMSRIL